MRILGRKFYAYKSKNRRKNTPDSAFPRTLKISLRPQSRDGYLTLLNLPIGNSLIETSLS